MISFIHSTAVDDGIVLSLKQFDKALNWTMKTDEFYFQIKVANKWIEELITRKDSFN